MNKQNQTAFLCECELCGHIGRLHLGEREPSVQGQVAFSQERSHGWFLPHAELTVYQMELIGAAKATAITAFGRQVHTHRIANLTAVGEPDEYVRAKFNFSVLEYLSPHFLHFDVVGEPMQPLANPSPTDISQFLRGASLLNRENQPLATGEAVLYPWQNQGRFYPMPIDRSILDTLPRSACILKSSEGREYEIQPEQTMCQGKNRVPHFHFHYNRPKE
jgi:hypothetical protein